MVRAGEIGHGGDDSQGRLYRASRGRSQQGCRRLDTPAMKPSLDKPDFRADLAL
jgi:hypothetical protein